LLRYKTKDLVKFNYDKCECGRTFLRMEGGVIGRADDMFQFGGVNIYPSAIENFIRKVTEIASEYQLVVPPTGSGKKLLIKVEPATNEMSKECMQAAVSKFINDVVYNVKIAPQVEVVKVGSLTRFEGKAKRIVRM